MQISTAFLTLGLGALCGAANAAPRVSLVTDPSPGAPAHYALGKLKAALGERQVAFEEAASLQAARGEWVVIAGLASGNGPAAALARTTRTAPPQGPEALVVRQVAARGRKALLVLGSDDRGLMYALLDMADRVGWAVDPTKPLSEVRDAREKPDAPERALSIYTMNRAYWESRFYDEAYWARYLDTLARNRFSTLVIIFGYENGGFLAPPYPYFFDVDGFPDVRMVGISPLEQARNLAALKRLIALAHERGLGVTLGIWDHIYRGGVQGGGIANADEALRQPTPGLVWGVTEKNLVPYTQAALAELLRRVPEVDALQFRMHDESGLANKEQEGFWRDVFRMMKERAPHLRFDARAKGLPDSVIGAGLEMGVPLRITTKYWMEQMGLPFHPSHINRQNQFDRRHSYADLLRYPQRYKMHWRLWNGGTARVLLWGDPDYVRRFVQSTHLYDGDGFEVNEPLATKMEAQPHNLRPFDLLAPAYRYTDYEFERYWHFFQVFGRLGYNPQTPSEVWEREFERRFGKAAAPHVATALHRASWILPRIVAACYPYGAFPMTRGWAERQRLGDLPAYAKNEGSDTEQFVSFDEEAANLLEGRETTKCRPGETARWLAQVAREVAAEADQAEKLAPRSKELVSTLTDLRILANLALFHARRIPAAVSYCLFRRGSDPRALDEAIAGEQGAVDAWRQLVAAAGDVYTDDLMMGVRSANLCGHWRDELPALEKGLAALEQQRRALPAGATTKPAPLPATPPNERKPPVVVHQPIRRAPAGKPLAVTAEVSGPSGVKWVRLRYRAVSQYRDYETLEMEPAGDGRTYRAVLPAERIDPTFDLMYFIEAMDRAGNGCRYPSFEKEAPYVVVRLVRE